MAKETKAQKETISRVMHEYKHGELRINENGPKVKDRNQAVAIALEEAGATNQESPKKNRQHLSRTKKKEHRGETAEAEAEGKKAQDRTMSEATGSNADSGKTKSELYDEAKKRDIPGRSKMSKRELEKALS